MAINNVVLTGRLAKEPELRQTQSGVSVLSFTVAVDRPYKSGEEKLCDFINCTAWRGTADFISKYFHKGGGIGIVGSIQTRKWTTDSGENRYATEVLAQNVSFLEGKKSAESATASNASNDGSFAEIAQEDGELPF